MRPSWAIWGLIGLFACGRPAPPAASSLEEARQFLDQALAEIREEEHLMGMAVAVIRGDTLAYAGGFGYANFERGIEMAPHTKLRMASISKSITATALMMLYEEGRCQLDVDVSPYLGFSLRNPHAPEVPITLEMLMSHTASLKDGEGYVRFIRDMRAERLSVRRLFDTSSVYFTEDVFLEEEPGTYFRYANISWGLIATVIERLSGQRFDEFCRDRIFRPLDMDASFNLAHLEALDSLAVLYRFEEEQWVGQVDNLPNQPMAPEDMSWYQPGHNGFYFGPQGSLRASVLDLVHFVQLHLQQGRYGGIRLLKASTVARMHAQQWRYDGENGHTSGNFMMSWGLGFHRLTLRDSADVIFPDRPMLGHPGEAYGLISDLYFDPQTHSGVIFATNGSRYPYKYGLTSTFYRPEERVFQAIWQAGLHGQAAGALRAASTPSSKGGNAF